MPLKFDTPLIAYYASIVNISLVPDKSGYHLCPGLRKARPNGVAVTCQQRFGKETVEKIAWDIESLHVAVSFRHAEPWIEEHHRMLFVKSLHLARDEYCVHHGQSFETVAARGLEICSMLESAVPFSGVCPNSYLDQAWLIEMYEKWCAKKTTSVGGTGVAKRSHDAVDSDDENLLFIEDGHRAKKIRTDQTVSLSLNCNTTNTARIARKTAGSNLFGISGAQEGMDPHRFDLAMIGSSTTDSPRATSSQSHDSEGGESWSLTGGESWSLAGFESQDNLEGLFEFSSDFDPTIFNMLDCDFADLINSTSSDFTSSGLDHTTLATSDGELNDPAHSIGADLTISGLDPTMSDPLDLSLEDFIINSIGMDDQGQHTIAF